MYEALLTDCCGFASMDIMESTNGGLLKFRGKFQEAEAVNKNKRMYPYDVLNGNVKKLQEAMRNRSLIGELDHPCMKHKDFEVLTTKGFKKFSEIRIGDYVYSRVNGKMVPSRVNDVIDKPYDGKVIHVKGRAMDCTFTAPHKFLMCKRSDHSNGGEQYYATIEDIHSNRTKYSHDSIPKTASWEGKIRATITVPGVERSRLPNMSKDIEIDTYKFMTFLGLYLAEGSIKKNKNSNLIEISQITEYGKSFVRNMLQEFHSDIEWKENKRGFYTSDARLCDYLIPLGDKYNKYIPEEIKQLDSVFLEKLILAFAVGDGRILKSEDGGKTCINLKESTEELSLDNGKFSRMSIFSVSERLVDDLHECLVKCGRSGTRKVVMPGKDYTYAGRIIKSENKKPLHCLNISRSKSIHMDPRFLKTIEGTHTGSIYCLSTEHGNFYMKYKGKSFWTGNCDSIVHFANASHLITKLWWEGNNLMGEGEILGTPMGKVLKAIIEGGVRWGISSRGVGNGKTNENGILVIGESFKLITFDAVADPSTYNAFQEKVVDKDKNEWIDRNSPSNQEINNYELKNESPRIDTVSKEALIACLGGFVRTHVDQMRRGISI